MPSVSRISVTPARTLRLAHPDAWSGRREPRSGVEIPFEVHAAVEMPGRVRLGDEVERL